MATIYDLQDGIMTILYALEDEEVEVDEEKLKEALEHLEGDLSNKLDAYCKVIKNYQSTIDGMKAERTRLSNRINRYELIIAKMKSIITGCLLNIGETKYKTKLFNINRLNTKKLVVDTKNVPEEFKKEVTRKETDNDKIKEALNNGEELGFAKYTLSCTIQ